MAKQLSSEDSAVDDVSAGTTGAATSANGGTSASPQSPPQVVALQIASDLHLEFVEGRQPRMRDVLVPSAPNLALLGDIHVLGDSEGAASYEGFVRECAQHFERVILLAGNHEFYAKNKYDPVTHRQVIERLRRIAEVCGDGVVFLHNDMIELSVGSGATEPPIAAFVADDGSGGGSGDGGGGDGLSLIHI